MYVVYWASCSAFPTLVYEVKALNEKDIIVSFEADQSTSCVYPEGLSERSSSYYSIEDLFNRVKKSPIKTSKVFIAW